MSSRRIADLLNVSPRFLRSIQLERDFDDPSVLRSYVLTDFAHSCFGRIVEGLRPRSGYRAWRMTGDYGSGKSSFALLLAHTFAGHDGFPSKIKRTFNFRQYGVTRPKFVPVLVTCSRRSVSVLILEALHRTLMRLYIRGNKQKLISEIRGFLQAKQEPPEEQIISFIEKVNAQIVADTKGRGLLLILDELGKFLEFAAQNPHRQDIFLLQRLAEAATRSADTPLFVVCLLHQGFNAYSDVLDQSTQREWEKVAGRFEEIVFNQPVEQIFQLVASALNVRIGNLPPELNLRLSKAARKTINLGWYGSAPSRRIIDTAAQLFPLHPTVLPVLIRIFRRFGQNERSLFSFLLSSEPFGLKAFSEMRLCNGNLFRLHNLYDYVRTCFGHRLSILSCRSHWCLIDSVIESFSTCNELHIKTLKTIGILNLLNDSDLFPTEDAVVCALADSTTSSARQIKAVLNELRMEKKVLYDRGRSRGLCLWPHSSVDLEKAYDDACRATETPQRVSAYIKDYLETRPVVARRHYIETGTLRHYDVRYCPVGELPDLLKEEHTSADGLIVVPLCETTIERNDALSFVKSPELKKRPNWLIAVPQPLSNLASLVQEVQRWEWVATNTLELNADKYGREEVSRQCQAAKTQLDRQIKTLVGLRHFGGNMMMKWFHKGRSLRIRDGRHLLEKLSQIFDETYSLAPHIQNELVNRRNLSSAAAAARMRLIERMFTHRNIDCLGMDPDKKPPEMSIYLSVIQNTRIHQRRGNTWRIGKPHHKTDKKCRVLPTLRRIHEILQKQPDSRVNLAMLFEELRKPPYGVRDGIIPLLLTVFAIAHEKEVAFYRDGTFLRELNGETMLVLTKSPERFDIQYCKIKGVRAELFERLLAVLELELTEDREAELLDVVKKLCVFVAQRPAYVLNTRRLSPTTLAVRDTILNAREPVTLLFTDLPMACGFEPIAADATSGKAVHTFVNTLKKALDELRAAFPELQERMRKQLRDCFELPGTFEQFRKTLAIRAEQLLFSVKEPKLKAFCIRLKDENLPASDWLESLGSYLALKPPSKWRDAEEDVFHSELAQFAKRFHNVESIAFAGSKFPKNTMGVRLAITQANGIELEQVVHFTDNEEYQLRKLQKQFEALLARNGRLSLAAVSRAIGVYLNKGRTLEA